MIRLATLSADGSVTCLCGLVIHFLPGHPHDEKVGHGKGQPVLLYGTKFTVNHQDCPRALAGPADDAILEHVDGQPSPAGPSDNGGYETINRLPVEQLNRHYGREAPPG